MNDLILRVLVGHLVGDFFLQHKKIADNKWKSGAIAYLWCTIHVTVYTLSVCASVGEWSTVFFLGVATPHFLIDKYSLALQWMKVTDAVALRESKSPIDNAFGVVIYVVIDQSLHLGSFIVLFQFLNL